MIIAAILLAIFTAAAGLLIGLVVGFLAGSANTRESRGGIYLEPLGSSDTNPFTDGPQPRSDVPQP